jgi:hypothetical protein
MSYKYEVCATYTSAEIESWIKDVEKQLQQHIENNRPQNTIEMLQKQLDDLRADLILKKTRRNQRGNETTADKTIADC